jgi:hypothetical protein
VTTDEYPATRALLELRGMDPEFDAKRKALAPQYIKEQVLQAQRHPELAIHYLECAFAELYANFNAGEFDNYGYALFSHLETMRPSEISEFCSRATSHIPEWRSALACITMGLRKVEETKQVSHIP